MSQHLFGAVVTGYGTAANNRGENEGNITTLQKLLWNGEVHTTLSAEAIRWAVRFFWQRRAELGAKDLETNRRWDDEKGDNKFEDPTWAGWASEDGKTYIDDDVLGFMRAEAAKEEGGEEEAEPEETSEGDKKKKGGSAKASKKKGTVNKRRGVLELTRAVSLLPFAGDITFNAKSGEKGRTSLYGTEVHATRYQYGFALTPSRLRVPGRALHVIDALTGLGEVAGNHSRFLYDFSPESVVLRLTEDMAPRLLYCFVEEEGKVDAPALVDRVESKDIQASELIIGGAFAQTPTGQRLKELGAWTHPGVIAAAAEAKKRVSGKS